LCVDGVTPEERQGLDLSLWLFAGCASEPVRADTLEQFAAAYAEAGFQPWAFVPNYGLSEQPGITRRQVPRSPKVVAFDRAALAQNRVAVAEAGAPGSVRLVSNGLPAPDATVLIVTPASETRCAPGEVGELWAHSVYTSRGYWRRPQATAETFGAHL